MWICSKLGFYSIVQKGYMLHIRARRRDDLDRLLREADCILSIVRWDDADYRWRVILPINSPVRTRIWRALLDSIDYSNFKDEIHQTPEQADKLPAYSAFWASMQKLQR